MTCSGEVYKLCWEELGYELWPSRRCPAADCTPPLLSCRVIHNDAAALWLPEARCQCFTSFSSLASSTAAWLLSAGYANIGLMHVIIVIIIILFLIYRHIRSRILRFIATAVFSLITNVIWNGKQFASCKSLHHSGWHFIWMWEYCLTKLRETWCYRKLQSAFKFRGRKRNQLFCDALIQVLLGGVKKKKIEKHHRTTEKSLRKPGQARSGWKRESLLPYRLGRQAGTS